MSKETYINVKRDLHIAQGDYIQFLTEYKSKETSIYVKRDLYKCQKRPTYCTRRLHTIAAGLAGAAPAVVDR